MSSPKLRRLFKYVALGGITSGTLLSLRANDYQWNSIGIVRFGRAAVTVFGVASIYKRFLYHQGLDPKSDDYETVKSYCHQLAANELLKLCCINRGVFIKVGQHIAALDYLLPREYVQTMKILHSHAPASKLSDVYRVIREDFKMEPSQVFRTIDPEPLGAASLAQVHKATLLDGSVVAVKVQHAYVKGNARVDMKTMEVLVKIVGWVFPDFKFQWLVDETKKNIPQELDFQQEGQNAERVSQLFKHYKWLKVPNIRWDLSTHRVLTMEFVEGGQVNDLEYIQGNKIDPFEVTDKLGKLYSQMIFINGFVHSDPHPGNILLKKTKNGTCDIILLDHGLYAKLSREFRVEYAQLWMSILKSDRQGMRLHSTNLGIKGDMYGLFACMVTGRSWDTILKGVEKRRHTAEEKKSMQKVLPNILPQISGILEDVNRQMLLILKTNDLIRGIEHTLKTSARMGAFRVMSQCCVRSIYQEKFDNAHSSIDRCKILVAQYWILFKINIYYTLLNFKKIYNDVIELGNNPLIALK